MKYVDPDGREAAFVLDEEGAGGMAHAGLYVKTNEGYSFFEVNGMDDNLQPGDQCQDYDNSVVLSNGPVSMPAPWLALSLGFATSAGASRRDFKSKEALMEYLCSAGSNNGYDTVIEFPTTQKQDSIIYSQAMKKGENFSGYELLGNSCGVYARNVLISPGTGIYEPSIQMFDLYGILDKNTPFAIGNKLLMANPSATIFLIKK